MALPNLGGATTGGTITEGQDNKEVTSNNLDSLLDNSQNASSDLVVTAGGTFNLDTPQAQLDIYLGSGLIRLTGTPGAATTIIVPDGDRRIAFENVSGQSATIDTVTGATPSIALPTGVSTVLHVRGIEITKTGDTAATSGALQADGSVAVTGDFDWADNELKRAYLIDYAEGLFNPVAAAAITLDFEVASVFDVTMDQATTFTFTNPPATGRVGSFTLILRQDGAGGHVPTFPGSVDWNEASAPTFSTGANDIDIVTFVTVDGGTVWFGFLGGKNFG
jgi:hypothetical protein